MLRRHWLFRWDVASNVKDFGLLELKKNSGLRDTLEVMQNLSFSLYNESAGNK